MPFRLQAHGASDVGLVRVNNEDAWLISHDKQIFLLADGLGGHQAGEEASRESIECFFAIYSAWKKEQASKEKATETDVPEIIDALRQCFAQTNAYVFQLSFSHELLRGMGTTFCALSFHGNMVAISHVGDSRIYRLREKTLVQLTKDHCWTRGVLCDHQCRERKELDADESRVNCLSTSHSTPKGVLTKALGTTPFVEPTIELIEGRDKDLFLLCSDGLSDMIDHVELEKILCLPLTVGERVRTLISTAKENGGVDNITVILVEVMDWYEKNIP